MKHYHIPAYLRVRVCLEVADDGPLANITIWLWRHFLYFSHYKIIILLTAYA